MTTPTPRKPIRPRFVGEVIPNWDKIDTYFLHLHEVVKALSPLLSEGATWNPRLDSSYFCPNEEGLIKFLSIDKTNRGRYISQRRDCDNFAALLYSRASWFYGLSSIGIIVNSLHAWNVVVLADGQVKFIEPQNDVVFPYYEANSRYAYTHANIWM